MDFAIIAQIAGTHLLARKKQSIIAALGVTFGIAMFVTLMGFMTGLNQLLDGLILDRTPHIRLYNEIQPSAQQPIELAPELSGQLTVVRSVRPAQTQEKIRNSLPLINALRQDERVLGVAPQVKAQVFYQAGPINLSGLVQGIDVLEEEEYFSIDDYVIEGKITDLLSVNKGVILGAGLAGKMQVEIGDLVYATAPNGSRFPLKMVGTYQSGLAEIDNTQSYATLGTVQEILGESSSYFTDLHLKLYDVEKAPEMAWELSRLYEIDAIDIQQANAQFETGTSVRNIITYAVSFALLVVAGFGIFNILNMMIYEKMDDIAILKATGFSSRDVLGIFLIQALIIGIVGGLFGILLGIGLSGLIDNTPFETEALPTITTFPVNWNLGFYLAGIVFAMITTFFAGWIPSRKAGRIDPVEIIRGK